MIIIDSILWWRKPRGVAVKMNNGREIPCRVVRAREKDKYGQRAWLAIPSEPFGVSVPLWITAGRMIPRKTTIIMPLEKTETRQPPRP